MTGVSTIKEVVPKSDPTRERALWLSRLPGWFVGLVLVLRPVDFDERNSLQSRLLNRILIHHLHADRVLVATGMGKALDMAGFVHVLTAYALLPSWGNVLFAYTLPILCLLSS